MIGFPSVPTPSSHSLNSFLVGPCMHTRSSHMTQPSLLASSKNTTNASHKKMPPTSWWEGDLEKPGHSNCNQVFILF